MGTGGTIDLDWDFSTDKVRVTYDPDRTSVRELRKAIINSGFAAQVVDTRNPSAQPGKPWTAPIPSGAPGFFREALTSARVAGKPVVLDFWAKWCAPCRRLKSETFRHSEVAKKLADVELVFVDVEQYPELAKSYQVRAIPDIFFIDRQGLVVDRLTNFEPAADLRPGLLEPLRVLASLRPLFRLP